MLGPGPTGRDGQSPDALQEEWATTASILQRKMRNGSLEFTSYKEVLISKGAHSAPRVVSVPTARDRIALKALAVTLAGVFPEAKTPMAQVRVAQVVDSLSSGSFESFVRIDVKNFYPSIPHTVVMDALTARIRKPAILALARKALSTPTVPVGSARPHFSKLFGVPQGLSVSNLLAEIVMADVDNEFSSRTGLAYFRYVDDILILCREAEPEVVFGDLSERLGRMDLEVHRLGSGSKSQTGQVSDPFEFLGYRFHGSAVGVRQSSVQKLENRLVQLFTAYKHESARVSSVSRSLHQRALLRRVDLVIAGCVFESVPRGWVQYFSQLNDLRLLKRLDAFVSRLVIRFALPPEFATKTFTRAYWHVTHPTARTSEYIPNFDKFDTSAQRRLLAQLFPVEHFDPMSEGEIKRRFHSEVKRLVAMLERDISQTS